MYRYRARLAALLLLPLLCWTVTASAESRFFKDNDGRVMELAVSDHISSPQREAVDNWLHFIADALADVYGHWPRRRWRIWVEPVSGSSEDPIPWAQVRRGAIDTVEFYIIHNASETELKQAWTGYHELAHLLLPYRGWGDTWFSEGLASYYQNLMQVRAGVISERRMWQKLYEGFERGRNDSRFDGQPLAIVSANMRVNGGFMRVYWSGAWYFLQADLHLRQQSAGKQNLDTALEALNECCDRDSMSVPEIVARLDKLNETDVFTDLYRRLLVTEQQPDYAPLFEQLDIAVLDDQVVLGQDGNGAALRRGFSATTPL